jgi:hypothetical protein
MTWVTCNTIKDRLKHIYENGLPTGVSVGWDAWDEYYTVLKGTTTYWGGLSSHGKSYMLFNVLKNLSDLYGWKHAIFSPEMGNADRVLSKLIKIHSGKDMDKKYMNEDEFHRWVLDLEEKYFILQLKDDELYLDRFIDECKTLLINEEVDTITLDPFNELRHSFEKHGGREDKYLEDRLTEIRRMAMDYNVHINIVAHARSDRTNRRGEHPNPPSMYEFSGGEAFANKAMNVIIVHRPAIDDGGIEFPDHNQSEVYFAKIKPEEVGKRGNLKMWFRNSKFSDSIIPIVRF